MKRAFSPWSTIFRGTDDAVAPMLGGHIHLATAPCPVEEERGLGDTGWLVTLPETEFALKLH